MSSIYHRDLQIKSSDNSEWIMKIEKVLFVLLFLIHLYTRSIQICLALLSSKYERKETKKNRAFEAEPSSILCLYMSLLAFFESKIHRSNRSVLFLLKHHNTAKIGRERKRKWIANRSQFHSQKCKQKLNLTKIDICFFFMPFYWFSSLIYVWFVVGLTMTIPPVRIQFCRRYQRKERLIAVSKTNITASERTFLQVRQQWILKEIWPVDHHQRIQVDQINPMNKQNQHRPWEFLLLTTKSKARSIVWHCCWIFRFYFNQRHEDIKHMLDSNKDPLKLDAMRRVIGVRGIGGCWWRISRLI